jgi:glycosyltransferase involved in cell wall biosynthesis
MKILIVSQYFWPEEFRINDLAVGLKERGHEVTVLTGLPNYPGGKLFSGYGYSWPLAEDYQGVKILRVPLIPRGAGSGWRLALNYVSFALAASVLGPWLCRDYYDAIFVFEISPVTVGLPAIVLKYLRRSPIHFWVLDVWPESLSVAGAVRSEIVLKAAGWLVRFIYARCDHILVQSRGFIPRVAALSRKGQPISYFPSWAEDVYTRSVVSGRTLSRIPGELRLMFAGNVGAAQDFGTLLCAMEELKSEPDVRLVVVGEGRQYPWAQEQVHARGLIDRVRFMGRRPIAEMPGLFADADALLVTLKSDPIFSLTIPGRIQSYMACARPIIAMLDGEGARVVEESGAGLTCAAGDASGLVRAILDFKRLSSQERDAMGQRGRDYYDKHFSRQRALDQVEGWIARIPRNHAVEAAAS